MVDDDRKKRAEVAFRERLDDLCSEVDKDYQGILKFDGSLEEILEKIKNYDDNHEIKWRSLENDLFIPYKLADRIDICQARQQMVFSDSYRGLTLIKFGLLKIKDSTCNKCRNQLTKNSCYVYCYKNQIERWTIEQAQNFNSEDFYPLFCSENCFKQSTYYQENNQSSRERERERESKSNQTKQYQSENTPEHQEPLYCSGLGCYKEIPNQTYFQNKSKKDNKKFCSKQCYTDYYGEYCYECMNKFLMENLYAPIKGNSRYLLCLPCWEKKKQEEREKNKKYCFKCQVELTDFNNKTPPFAICDFCFEKDLEQAKMNSNENRTEPQPTINQIKSLFAQLLTQIQATHSPNSPLYQKALKEQKEALTILENASESKQEKYLSLIRQIEPLLTKPNLSLEEQTKLNQTGQKMDEMMEKLRVKKVKVEQRKNNHKLWLGIGCGVLGLGLISLLVYLVRKKR